MGLHVLAAAALPHWRTGLGSVFTLLEWLLPIPLAGR